MASSARSPETLELTPTWVLAAVCTVIVVISLCAERLLHYLGKFLKRKRQDALFQALEKLKEELMLLGFISLLLTVSQSLISHICIPESVSSHMLPCKKESSTPEQVVHHWKVFPNGGTWNRRRLLSLAAGSNLCMGQGKVQLLSLEALHQLHIFIFVLAVVHVLFCATTMVLGGAKIRQWKHWEYVIRKENLKQEKPSTSEHLMPAHPHHEFVKERAFGFWRKSAVVSWTMSFFKQFHASVTRSDYRALRDGFIMIHCRGSPNFDFYKYMMRALEDDFKKVVGISWYLWLFLIVFLLLNVNGWHTYFWLSFLPLILLLTVGAKLEHIITRLAHEVAGAPMEEPGAPRGKPSDERFWFHRPGIVLYLIHFILFQNSFEIAFFFWIWSTYGFNSCILGSVGYIIPRLVIGVIVQVLCSYSTLPLYAIVTQMGDTYKQAIFAEHMRTTLHGWVADIRKRKRAGAGFSSVLRIFGHKDKKRGVSCTEIQMHRMGSEGSWSSDTVREPAALESIVASAIEQSELGNAYTAGPMAAVRSSEGITTS